MRNEGDAVSPFGFDPVSRAYRAEPWTVYDRMRDEDVGPKKEPPLPY